MQSTREFPCILAAQARPQLQYNGKHTQMPQPYKPAITPPSDPPRPTQQPCVPIATAGQAGRAPPMTPARAVAVALVPNSCCFVASLSEPFSPSSSRCRRGRAFAEASQATRPAGRPAAGPSLARRRSATIRSPPVLSRLPPPAATTPSATLTLGGNSSRPKHSSSRAEIPPDPIPRPHPHLRPH